MRSMTGYGRGRAENEDWEVDVILRSVNHRFLDLAIRLGREQSFLEQTIRNTVSRSLRRGHVEISLSISPRSADHAGVKVDRVLCAYYLKEAAAIGEENGLNGQLTLRDLLTLEGVCVPAAPDYSEDVLKELCEKALQTALSQMLDMREKEGENLRKDLLEHLGIAEKIRSGIAGIAPEAPEAFRLKLQERLKTLQGEEVDPVRLAQEVALMADRCAVDEELSRLESHFFQMHRYLDAEEDIGKKMDFLIQEMNRETNTIGSKSADIQISKLVLELKSEIEKMREQVQNVE